MAKVGVLGAGSWGTALAILLHDNGHDVTVWSIDPKEVEMLSEKREHVSKLPGVHISEEIMITKEGKDLLIGFNPKFLIDALRVIDDEEVTIYLMNAKAPCFIKDDEESYIYLILPVNFNAAA